MVRIAFTMPGVERVVAVEYAISRRDWLRLA